MPAAHETLYRLVVADLPAGTFAPLAFEAWEAISQPGWIRATVLSEERGLEHEELIGKSAVFTVLLDGGHDFCGVVSEFCEEPYDERRSRYEIVVRDRLALLGGSGRCRVFQNRSAPEILDAVLKPYGIDGKRLRKSLKKSYPPLMLCVQYNESDLEFFQRVARAAGIIHFCATEEGDGVLTLSDDNSGFPPSIQDEDMEYRPDAGMVEESISALSSLRRTNASHVGKVRLVGYDYENPQTQLSGTADGSGQGDWVRYDADLKSAAQAVEKSRFHREASRATHERVQAVTSNPRLRAGETFSISQVRGAGFGGEYLLLEVRHRGSQEGSATGNGKNIRYGNQILCQPCSLPYRDVPLSAPRIPGVIVAKVDAPDGPYAHLDGQGRYRARLPFDEGSPGPGPASPPIRMAQPYAGPNYGLHLPLHKGVDLVLAFEDGDIDRPIALGAVPNPAQTSPVTASNKTESVLRTASGNLLTLDDLDGKTRILLQSSQGRLLLLDDDADTAGMLLSSVHKHRVHLDDKNDLLEISTGDGKHALTIEDAKGILTLRTTSGHLVRMSDDSKAVTVQSANGHRLCLDDGAGLLTLQDKDGKHKIQIDVGGRISLTTEGDLEFEAKGSLKMKAADMSFESGSGTMNLK